MSKDFGETEREPLTRRECQVLMLLCDGATTAQIAFAFGLADTTVDQHIFAARQKLGVRNRVELVSYALRKSLVSLGEADRPGVVEVEWIGHGKPGNLVFRYVSGEGDRAVPSTNRAALNQDAEDWIGTDWILDLAPLIAALWASRSVEEPVFFEGASTYLEETGVVYEWSGWVAWIRDERFMVVVTTPFPGTDSHSEQERIVPLPG